jgi:FtsZ-binding cell division protein ZapB
MKKYINGKYVEMTKAEIEELKARANETPELQETVEDLIAKIEASRREQDELMDRLRSMVEQEAGK